MSKASFDRFERKLVELTRAITDAAVAYEARWTLAALHRVDADIHARLRRQIDLWREASCRGSEYEIVAQGEALVRGYRRAVEVMTENGESDGAYLIGRDAGSGLTVAIGHSTASAGRVAALYPDAVFWTVDEVTAVLSESEAFQRVSAIKRAFPGAVATEFRPRTNA